MDRDDDDASSNSDDSSDDDDIQSESTPILNITEILSITSSSDSNDDQSSQSTPTKESIQDLIDSIIQGDPATENESNTDGESSSDESSSNTDGSQTPDYDPANTGAEFRHMVMRNTRNPNPMNTFQTPDSNHQANVVTLHTAMATKPKCHKYQ